MCYRFGWFNDYDWRGLGLALGLTSILPLGYTWAAYVRHGPKALKEAFITMAKSEKTPVGVYFGVMAFFFIAGIASALSLILSHS